MKFISKSSNLLIVLRSGIQAQPITGAPATPTISVRFKDGMADVQQEEIIAMMLKHPGFNSDFISAESVSVDPYAVSRQPSEPTHVLTEMKFGTPVGRSVQGGQQKQFSPEIMKLIEGMAAEMASKMLPSMVESTLKSLVKANEEDKSKKEVESNIDDSTEEVKKIPGKPGRKPKVLETTV